MRYINPHFGCPHEICYMKPKLMKEHIEWVYGGCDPSQIDKFRTDQDLKILVREQLQIKLFKMLESLLMILNLFLN